MTKHPCDIDDLAHALAHHGPQAVEASLAAVASAARARGCSATLADVLADPAQPAVARQRAFGLLAVALVAADDASDWSEAVAA